MLDGLNEGLEGAFGDTNLFCRGMGRERRKGCLVVCLFLGCVGEMR